MLGELLLYPCGVELIFSPGVPSRRWPWLLVLAGFLYHPIFTALRPWNCLAGIHSLLYHLSQHHCSLKDYIKHHLHPTFFVSLAGDVTLQEILVRCRTQGAHAMLLIETENNLSQ